MDCNGNTLLLQQRIESFEDPASIFNLIQEVRDNLSLEAQGLEETGISLSKIDRDDFILKFLRSRSYDVNKTVDSILMYLKAKKTHREIFTPPSQLKAAFDAGIIGILPDRNPGTNEGILVTRPGAWDPNTISFETYTAATAVTLEVASMDPDIQVNGIIDISQSNTLFRLLSLFQSSLNDLMTAMIAVLVSFFAPSLLLLSS